MQSLRSFGRRIVSSYKVIAILTLNTLILLAGFELAGRTALKIRSSFSMPAKERGVGEELLGEGGPREKVSYYASQDWSERYWHEFRLARRHRYYPYVGWRRAPVEGKTISIDQNGIRLTPGANCGAESFKVFAFGGSTMWGTGAPNWGTIPAYLQAGLNARIDRPVCVVNFGETAYVSTQGVITLMLQLKSENVPDLVIFYEGNADVAVAYGTGLSGIHANLDQIAAKLEGRSASQDHFPIVEWLMSSYSFSLVQNFIAKITSPVHTAVASAEQKRDYETMGIDVATLRDSVVQSYLGNYEIVSALAKKYGFNYFFFWQPVLVLGDKPLTAEEQEMKHRIEPARIKLFELVNRAIEAKASKDSRLHSMAHIFDGINSLLYIDAGHVTPVGNQLIAEKMIDIMASRDSFKPARASHTVGQSIIPVIEGNKRK